MPSYRTTPDGKDYRLVITVTDDGATCVIERAREGAWVPVQTWTTDATVRTAHLSDDSKSPSPRLIMAGRYPLMHGDPSVMAESSWRLSTLQGGPAWWPTPPAAVRKL